jgi:hypothetical protein
LDGPHSDISLALGMDNPGKTRIYQSWYDDALSKNSYARYNDYMIELWDRLTYGDTLHDAKIAAEEISGGQGWDISDNLIDYGVSEVGHGDQYIRFQYPNIN